MIGKRPFQLLDDLDFGETVEEVRRNKVRVTEARDGI